MRIKGTNKSSDVPFGLYSLYLDVYVCNWLIWRKKDSYNDQPIYLKLIYGNYIYNYLQFDRTKLHLDLRDIPYLCHCPVFLDLDGHSEIEKSSPQAPKVRKSKIFTQSLIL